MGDNSSGRWGEERAKRYLQWHGWHIEETNYSCRFGEIDLIAADFREEPNEHKPVIVFIEVKYRSSPGSGYGREAVSWKKQWKISRTADYYCMTHNIWDSTSFRFDVISIDNGHLNHIPNAFNYTERSR